MSSTFELLCASHTPALELAADEPTSDAAMRWLADGLPEHPHCDILIARRSGGLVEFGCPPSAGRSRGCCHGGVEWADVRWLRLLAAATSEDHEHPPTVAAAVAQIPRCWTSARMAAIATLL